MNTKMEKIKKDLYNRNNVFIGIIALASATLALNNAGIIDNYYQNTSHAEFMHGFLLGLVIVLDLISVFNICKNLAAMNDEKKMTRLYNEYNDERTQHIRLLSGSKALVISMIIILAAALIVCLFSFEAFLALIGAVFVLGIVRKICCTYYSKNYTGQE